MGKILINEKQLEFVTEYVLLEQQSVGDVVQIDGKKYKITDCCSRRTYSVTNSSCFSLIKILPIMICYFIINILYLSYS